ncbi:MAG: hypothetical protein RMI88_07735 [Nitrososphaerota archaeon]|nr:hypothetical protein [Nitrososphaerota archaeon]
MTVHTYHYHHVITVGGEGGGGGGEGGEARTVWGAPWAPPAQHGAWYTREGPYYLHRGEMVLPRHVAEWFRGHGPVTKNVSVNVNINASGVSDPKVLADIVSREIARRLRAM